MQGWRATGRTNPKWRSCPHEVMVNECCAACNACRVDDDVQQLQGRGGLPLGSPYLVRMITVGVGYLKGDETSATRFMGSKVRKP